MIVRIWGGSVPSSRANAFQTHLHATGLSDYARQPGCREVRLWRAPELNGLVRFTLASIWSDMDAIRAFAGPDTHRAVLYAGDEAFELIPDLVVEPHDLASAQPAIAP